MQIFFGVVDSDLKNSVCIRMDPLYFRKLDPDPHNSEKVEALRGSFWSIGGSISGGKVSGRIRIRIRLKLKGRIRIRIRVKGRIRIWIRIKVKSLNQISLKMMRNRYTAERYRMDPNADPILF